MTRSILDRTYELLLSNESFVIKHEPFLKEELELNKKPDSKEKKKKKTEILMKPFGDFKRDVQGHLQTIKTQTKFILKHLGYYKWSILYIMKLRIDNRKTYLRLTHFIDNYFNNIRSIMTTIYTNVSNLDKHTDNYYIAISKYNQKHFRVSRKARKPSDTIKDNDKKIVLSKFYKLRNAGDKDFKVLLQMIKLSERQENSNNMKRYKNIISRSSQKLP
jgi:hypothetical protein